MVLAIMKYAIINIKRKQLESCQLLLKKEQHDIGKKYLRATIETLEREVNGIPDKSINDGDKRIEKLLQHSDLTEMELQIFATLLANEPLQASDMVKFMERGKVYRTLESLIDREIVVKLPSQVTKYTVLDKKDPLRGIINNMTLRLSKHEAISNDITELMKHESHL